MANQTKKLHPGAPLGNQNAAKAPEDKSQKKLVSAWVEPDVHETLKALAKRKKSTPSREVALILSQVLRATQKETDTV